MTDGDAGALFSIYGDPLVMRYTDEAPFPSVDTVEVMLKSVRRLLLDGVSLEWAIVLKGREEVIGTCGLHGFDTTLAQAEVGCLLKRCEWGKGLMPEALALLARFAADSLKLKRLIADVAPENLSALRLFHKLGYRQERPGILALDL
ncbi:MAG: GNAT family N-acetyltransferase [Duganella sp.]